MTDFLAGVYTFVAVFLLSLVIALLFLYRHHRDMVEQREQHQRLIRAWVKSESVDEEEW